MDIKNSIPLDSELVVLEYWSTSNSNRVLHYRYIGTGVWCICRVRQQSATSPLDHFTALLCASDCRARFKGGAVPTEYEYKYLYSSTDTASIWYEVVQCTCTKYYKY